jgi:hypothetical protein
MLMAGIDTILQNETRRKLLWLKERQAFAWDWRLAGIRYSIVGVGGKEQAQGAKIIVGQKNTFPNIVHV